MGNGEANLGELDPTTMTIQEAIGYQQKHNMDIETFTNTIANKMKFQLKDFNVLCSLIFFDD